MNHPGPAYIASPDKRCLRRACFQTLSDSSAGASESHRVGWINGPPAARSLKMRGCCVPVFVLPFLSIAQEWAYGTQRVYKCKFKRERNHGQVAKKLKRTAQARNRTGGSTMATLNFTTKPLALVTFQKCVHLPILSEIE